MRLPLSRSKWQPDQSSGLSRIRGSRLKVSCRLLVKILTWWGYGLNTFAYPISTSLITCIFYIAVQLLRAVVVWPYHDMLIKSSMKNNTEAVFLGMLGMSSFPVPRIGKNWRKPRTLMLTSSYLTCLKIFYCALWF